MPPNALQAPEGDHRRKSGFSGILLGCAAAQLAVVEHLHEFHPTMLVKTTLQRGRLTAPLGWPHMNLDSGVELEHCVDLALGALGLLV